MLDQNRAIGLRIPRSKYVGAIGKRSMALCDLKRTRNKWALHTWDGHAIFVKLGDIDYPNGFIPVVELYQTYPKREITRIFIGSAFDKKAIICRSNIAKWLKIFYPSLQKII